MCHKVVKNESQEYKSNRKLSPWGHYGCDAPWKLIKDSVEMLTERFSNPDFILWTG